MRENRGRNVAGRVGSLVEGKHLKEAGEGKEQDRGCDEDADVVVGDSESFEGGCGGHIEVSFAYQTLFLFLLHRDVERNVSVDVRSDCLVNRDEALSRKLNVAWLP